MAAIERLDTAANNRYSEAAIHGGVVYLAGQVPSDAAVAEAGAAGDRAAAFGCQMRSVLAQIDALLARARSSKARILSATVYLVDIKDKDAMNAAWESWMPADCAPARATVGGVALADARWLVEVVVVAAQGA